MIASDDTCQIVLTYKRKVLLKRRESLLDRTNKNTWSFFEDTCCNEESLEHKILKCVEEETSLVLSEPILLKSPLKRYKNTNYYQVALTDKNVNAIQRSEGKELQFFSIKEIEKLRLADSSQKLLELCKTQIEDSFNLYLTY